MEIIIFGGSFDPIHYGHLEIIEKIKSLFPNKKLFIIPTFSNPLKNNSLANPDLRLKWIQDIFKNDNDIIIENYELNKKKLSFTFNTVKYLFENYDIEKIDFIIGQDNLAGLDKWHKIEELKKNINFIVVSRGNNNKKFDIQVCNNANSSDIREKSCYEYVPNQIKEEVKEFYENNK